MASAKCIPAPHSSIREVARVLVVDSDPTARIILRTLLQAGGYGVSTASTAIEAISWLDHEEYELVLSKLHLESKEAGLDVIAHARSLDYRPATALICSWQEQLGVGCPAYTQLVEPENVPELLEKVAGMIGERAFRQLVRQMRHRA